MRRYEDVSQGYSEGPQVPARAGRGWTGPPLAPAWRRPGLGRVTGQPRRCVSTGGRLAYVAPGRRRGGVKAVGSVVLPGAMRPVRRGCPRLDGG